MCTAIIQLKALHHQDTERSLLDTEKEISDSSVYTEANNEELFLKCGRCTCMGLVCILYLITWQIIVNNVAPMMTVYIHLRTAKSKDLASIDKIIILKYCMKHVKLLNNGLVIGIDLNWN